MKTTYIENEVEQLRILLKHTPKIFNLLIDSKTKKLSISPDNVKLVIRGLSRGEKVLATLALDLWDGSGNTLFLDVVHLLDTQNKTQVLQSFNLYNLEKKI